LELWELEGYGQNGDKSKRRQTKTATGPKLTYKLAFVNYRRF